MHTLEEVAALLHIHEKAHAQGNMGNIAAAALNRLNQINKEMDPQSLVVAGPESTEAMDTTIKPSDDGVIR